MSCVCRYLYSATITQKKATLYCLKWYKGDKKGENITIYRYRRKKFYKEYDLGKKSRKILCNVCHEESRPRMWPKVVTNSFGQWEGCDDDIRLIIGQNSVTAWQRRMLCSVLSRLEHVPRSEYSELSGMYPRGGQSTTGASWHKLRRDRDASQWWSTRMTLSGIRKTTSRRRMTLDRRISAFLELLSEPKSNLVSAFVLGVHIRSNWRCHLMV